KKLRRIKAAKDLYRKSDERIIGYEKHQLLKMLANRSYHSLEINIQMAKLQRPRQYDDEVQHFDRIHPEDAPQWSYVKQEDFIYDTEIDRSGFDEDEDYGEETEEVLIDSQKSAASDDLAE
ncbi:7938_t:CDS:2, partial [Rhizophagus irregularis]